MLYGEELVFLSVLKDGGCARAEQAMNRKYYRSRKVTSKKNYLVTLHVIKWHFEDFFSEMLKKASYSIWLRFYMTLNLL